MSTLCSGYIKNSHLTLSTTVNLRTRSFFCRNDIVQGRSFFPWKLSDIKTPGCRSFHQSGQLGQETLGRVINATFLDKYKNSCVFLMIIGIFISALTCAK